VDAIDYEGSMSARACAPALRMLRDPALRAVIICPSNPMLSIEPMLAIPALRDAIRDCAAPVIAVSPIVRGGAIKGPTAKLLRELGEPVDALAAARRYRGLLDGYIVDTVDAADVRALDDGVRIESAPTVMDNMERKDRLAQACLRLADALARDAHDHRAMQ